ncbi:MAG: D-ribitol-5-phosphate phosphatase [Bacteroidia bacterium]|nr:D-ribitol-5-phosphate phosphatase [Bacteroidia bacterium]
MGPEKGLRNYTFAPNMQNKFPLQSNTKNIIFDLGGVILNIDYRLTSQAFKNLGLADFDEKYSQAKQSHLFDRLETGAVAPEQFRLELKAYFSQTVSDTDLDTAWNAMLLDLPKQRIDLLKELSKKYRLFLLSNTNIIHYNAYSAYLKTTFGKLIFDEIFEKQYLSFEVGMRKPDKEIFELVLNENKLLPSETLFIDDSIQHIEGARKTGINAYHLPPTETIIEVF